MYDCEKCRDRGFIWCGYKVHQGDILYNGKLYAVAVIGEQSLCDCPAGQELAACVRSTAGSEALGDIGAVGEGAT